MTNNDATILYMFHNDAYETGGHRNMFTTLYPKPLSNRVLL